MTADVVAVGVDGSPASDAALDFAIADATLTGRRIRAITAWWVGPALPEEHGARREERRRRAERAQADAVNAAVGRATKPVELDRVVTHGPPSEVLVHHARDAYELVLGASHKGYARRALEGSTSTDCVRRAACPVIIVPHPARASSDPDRAARSLPSQDGSHHS